MLVGDVRMSGLGFSKLLASSGDEGSRLVIGIRASCRRKVGGSALVRSGGHNLCGVWA